MRIHCPYYNIHLNVKDGGGSVLISDLPQGAKYEAVERLVLAHACAGVDVTTPSYASGVMTVVEALLNGES